MTGEGGDTGRREKEERKHAAVGVPQQLQGLLN